MVAVFALSLKRFLGDIHQNALAEGKTNKEKIEPVGFITSLVKIIPTVLKHNKFSDCTENKDREVGHLLTMYGFIGSFIVTSIIFLVLYGSYLLPDGPLHGPWSQLNPIKWLANLSGIAIIVGTILLIKNRKAKEDQISGYWDWSLVWLAFGLGLHFLFDILHSSHAGFRPDCLLAVFVAVSPGVPYGGDGVQ